MTRYLNQEPEWSKVCISLFSSFDVILNDYCTISVNLAETGNGPTQIAEM